MIAGVTTHPLLVALFAAAITVALFAGSAAAQPTVSTLAELLSTPTVVEPQQREDTANGTARHAAAPAATAQCALLDAPYSVYLPLVERGEKYPPANRAYEREVLRLVNEQRAAAGLGPLVEDPALTQAARRHAMDMALHTFASHTGSDGSDPWQRIAEEGFVGGNRGEAASLGWPTPSTAVLDGWMKSTPHREILLDAAANRVGVGTYPISTGAYAGAYAWVIDLGVMP